MRQFDESTPYENAGSILNRPQVQGLGQGMPGAYSSAGQMQDMFSAAPAQSSMQGLSSDGSGMQNAAQAMQGMYGSAPQPSSSMQGLSGDGSGMQNAAAAMQSQQQPQPSSIQGLGAGAPNANQAAATQAMDPRRGMYGMQSRMQR